MFHKGISELQQQNFPVPKRISEDENRYGMNPGKEAITSPNDPLKNFFVRRPSRADSFTKSVLREMTRPALKHNAITDEIYGHILYDDRSHVPIGTLDGMASRTITIGSFSETHSVTGGVSGMPLPVRS